MRPNGASTAGPHGHSPAVQGNVGLEVWEASRSLLEDLNECLMAIGKELPLLYIAEPHCSASFPVGIKSPDQPC
jgi:hypothetical protein